MAFTFANKSEAAPKQTDAAKGKANELQGLLSLINSEKKSKNLRRWKLLVTAAFCLILMKGILCIVFCIIKVDAYRNAYDIVTTFGSFTQGLIWSTFVSRKINILSFNNLTDDIG
jgi:hydrogenase-4 membrane subunit HyfE